MCRMIAAVGTYRAAAMRRALQRMASNDNPDHHHEQRRLGGDYRHEDGWGAAWVEHGALRHVRRAVSCLQDGELEQIDQRRTELMLLHARRSSKGVLAEENTHPFVAEKDGEIYAFCHNGTVEDASLPRASAAWRPGGKTDSEKLFRHILEGLDPRHLYVSVSARLDAIRDYTGMVCFLANRNWILAACWRHPEKGRPEYHALWEGWGRGVHVVSSEKVSGVGCDLWRRVPHRGIVLLEAPNTPVAIS